MERATKELRALGTALLALSPIALILTEGQAMYFLGGMGFTVGLVLHGAAEYVERRA